MPNGKNYDDPYSLSVHFRYLREAVSRLDQVVGKIEEWYNKAQGIETDVKNNSREIEEVRRDLNALREYVKTRWYVATSVMGIIIVVFEILRTFIL